MTEELQIEERPVLEHPVMIAAFRGWNDGGQGASLAGAYLAQAWAAERFATIESEGFYDFQATRPMVSLVDGETRQIDWPENTFLHAPLPGAGRDAIILLGVEPNLRWRTFCGHVTELASLLRSRARDHAGLVTRRCAAHAAGSRHRERDRPGSDRAARPAGVTLRRPDRDRRRAARRVRPRRPASRQVSGRPCRTTCR